MKPTMIEKPGFRHGVRAALVALFGALATVSGPAPALNLTDAPPYLITAVEPNVLLTFDDSGSMAWAYMPDTISGLSGTRRGCSSQINGVYYNPSVTYDPPVNANGNPLNAVPTSFTAAYRNGYNTAAGTVDLSNNYRPSWGSLTPSVSCNTAGVPGAAFYYTYDTGCGNPNSDTCYTLVRHNAPAAWSAAEQQNFANWYSYYRNRNLTAKTAAGRAFARFGTNVRVMGMHLNSSGGSTGSTAAIFPNNSTTTFMRRFCDDSAGTDPDCPNGTARSDFFQRLYNSPNSGSTPLRTAMYRAGQHFDAGNTGNNSPYRDVPGTAGSPERSCRLNFHIMMSDGYWNGGFTTSPPAGTNWDGGARTFPDGTVYSATQRPYSDAAPGAPRTDTLADLAFYYWLRDLRTDLTDNVPTRYADTSGTTVQNYWNPVNDPANWQRLNTFTIGLGIPGTMDSTDAATYNNLLNGTIGWPAPCDGCAGSNIDDLWHAALNTRSRYFSARNPATLVSAFSSIVNDIADRISSASSAALNSGTVSSNSYIYLSRFNSGDWSGQVLAYYINPVTLIPDATPAWDAGEQLNTLHYDTQRQIITYKPSLARGIPFRWPSNPATPGASELDTSQSTLLKYHPITGNTDADAVGEARLDYLRGDASNENGGLNFRVRNRTCGASPCPAGTDTGVLGDTVNSAPLYVDAPRLPYPDGYEAVAYSTFRTSYSGRTPVLYVGSNDGMLHAFNANNGRELLAYVPGKVYPHLSRLAHTPYAHKYFVDGDMTATDVFINGQWRTILVGSLRHGGQGIYALDITDPGNFSEANAQNLVLWEFTDNHDAELGYTYSKPAIAKMQNGRWAVIFGNGYNNSIASTVQPEIDSGATVSTTGRAALYILFIEAGTDGVWNAADFVKITVPSGTVGQPNGLATPAVADIEGDGKADYIYAGDLNGNMWRFDVTSPTPGDWNNSSNYRAIYTAFDTLGNAQPITSRPAVGFHPYSLPGLMVYFGTGKYIETTDASVVGATTQTFYGVWDQEGAVAPDPAPNRGDLLQQSVITTITDSGGEFRTTTNNQLVWRDGFPLPLTSYIGWYMDLPTTGERVFTNPVLREGRLLFTTAIPSSDPCLTGGDGWLMELKPGNGGRLAETFDVNGDGVIDANDLVTIGGVSNQAVSGTRITGGVPSSPAIINNNPTVSGTGTGSERKKYVSRSDGTLGEPIDNKGDTPGRSSWGQKR